MSQKQWAADAVERRSVKDLVPYDRNPRVHPKEQVEQLANSIEEWGENETVICFECATFDG